MALGDSYTIGTSVAEHERWPNQLVARLALGRSAPRAAPPRGLVPVPLAARAPAPTLDLVANLAVSGFTSADVIHTELPRLANLEPAVVSLLVGVNDVIRSVPEPAYRANLERILDVVLAMPSVRLVFGVTTPDYTVTPAGGDYGDPVPIAAAIRRFNAAFSAVLGARRLPVVDVHDLSLAARGDRSLVARDGLHPSAAQYGRWVDRIAPLVRAWLYGPDRGGDGGDGGSATTARRPGPAATG